MNLDNARCADYYIIVERLQRGWSFRGFGMSSARIASLFSVIIVLVAAPTEASSRMAPREAELTKASQSLLQPIGASSFTLNAAATIGSRWGSVTSTSRTRQRNYLVGGAANSFHLTGRAIDIARRPGVRHADIEASYRNAGFVLIESLDEGDHSHFAFGATRSGAANALRAEPRQGLRDRTSGCLAIAKTYNAALLRRRPDRNDDCVRPEELKEAHSVVAVGATAFE